MYERVEEDEGDEGTKDDNASKDYGNGAFKKLVEDRGLCGSEEESGAREQDSSSKEASSV